MPNTISGFSLIELMLASVLTLLLTLLLMQCYLHNRETYFHSQALARMQENARIASYLLKQELQTAGYLGCSHLQKVLPVENHLSTLLGEITPIHGFVENSPELKHYPFYPAIAQQLVNNSELILVHKMDTYTANVIQSSKNRIAIGSNAKFKEGTALIIADCKQAEIFQVKTVESNNKNQQLIYPIDRLRDKFPKNAQLGLIISELLYVTDTGRKNNRGNPIYALYCKDALGQRTLGEFAEGIERIAIDYGILTINNTIIFRKAEAVQDWQNVTLLRIHLLVNSVDEITSKPMPYTFLHKTFYPSDHLLRREWLLSIKLRELNV